MKSILLKITLLCSALCLTYQTYGQQTFEPSLSDISKAEFVMVNSSNGRVIGNGLRVTDDIFDPNKAANYTRWQFIPYQITVAGVVKRYFLIKNINQDTYMAGRDGSEISVKWFDTDYAQYLKPGTENYSKVDRFLYCFALTNRSDGTPSVNLQIYPARFERDNILSYVELIYIKNL